MVASHVGYRREVRSGLLLSRGARAARGAWALGVLAALSLAYPIADAQAQTASEISAAKQWFADGRTLEDKGEWARALSLFRRAAQVKKTPQILYHVGLCESRTGALVQAMLDLDAAAVLARNAHADDVVAASKAELADVKQRVPTLDVRALDGATPTRLVVDGSEVSLAMVGTPMPLDAGPHTVTLEIASGASATKKVVLAEKDAQALVLAPEQNAAPALPEPAPVPAPEVSPKPVAERASTPAKPAQSSMIPLLGIGGAVLSASGTVLFLVARAEESSLHSACPERVGCDPSLQADYDSAKTFNALGIAFGAAGLVAVGAAVTIAVLRPSSPASARAAIVLTPGGFGLSGAY